jgi:IclR family acetate operon transcriptional repressor
MSPYVVRSVVRALDVLTALAGLGRAATNAELSELTRLHPTTTLRMLESLAARGFVRQRPDASYDLAAGALDLGNAFLRRISISRHANEIAEQLAEEVHETASVGVLDEGRVLYVAIAHGQADLGIQSVPFGRHPLHCTALGKALLAALPWEEAEALLGAAPLPRLTGRTITDLAALKAEIDLTRGRGFAVDEEERSPGVVCIAAPIRAFAGEVVAAISASGPDFRMKSRGIEPMAAAVMRAAAEASQRLGFGEGAGRLGKAAAR